MGGQYLHSSAVSPGIEKNWQHLKYLIGSAEFVQLLGKYPGPGGF